MLACWHQRMPSGYTLQKNTAEAETPPMQISWRTFSGEGQYSGSRWSELGLAPSSGLHVGGVARPHYQWPFLERHMSEKSLVYRQTQIMTQKLQLAVGLSNMSQWDWLYCGQYIQAIINGHDCLTCKSNTKKQDTSQTTQDSLLVLLIFKNIYIYFFI